MHGHGTRQLSPPRSLTTAEREILRKLVAEISGSVEVLDCQTRHLRVIEECSVGCGTVALAVDEEACPSLDNQGGAPSSGLGADEHGSPIEVLSHFRDGYLRMIELVRLGGGLARGLPPAHPYGLKGA